MKIAVIGVFIALSAVIAGQNPTAPFSPQPILQGGQVVPLFSSDSAYLKKERRAPLSRNVDSPAPRPQDEDNREA